MGNSGLDSRLVAEGLAQTRPRARDCISRGFVRVSGSICNKPGHMHSAASRVELVAEAPKIASRGAEKLSSELDAFCFDPSGRVAIDVGASPGGFTEVLLQSGARRVCTVDVWRRQLYRHWRDDPRYTSLEQQDVRTVTGAHVAEPIEALVADVRFISLADAPGASLLLKAPGAWLAALIKAQFEVAPGAVGAGGIVRDDAARAAAGDAAWAWIVAAKNWRVLAVIAAPILGRSGYLEYLFGAVRDA